MVKIVALHCLSTILPEIDTSHMCVPKQAPRAGTAHYKKHRSRIKIRYLHYTESKSQARQVRSDRAMFDASRPLALSPENFKKVKLGGWRQDETKRGEAR